MGEFGKRNEFIMVLKLIYHVYILLSQSEETQSEMNESS